MRPHANAPKLSGDNIPVIVLLLSVLVVYGACAAFPYALSDDYGQMLYLQNGWTDWIRNPIARDGRPISSALVCHGFLAAGSLGRLYLLRIVSLAFTLAFAAYFNKVALRIGYDRWQALMLSSIVVFSPGIGEFVGWTVCWPYMPGLLLTTWLSAGFSRRASQDATAKKRMLHCFIAFATLEMVMLVYQPLAGFFIIIPLLWLAKGKLRPMLLGLPVLIVAFGFYRFAMLPSLHMIVPAWGIPGRGALTGNLVGHLLDTFDNFQFFIASSWATLLVPRGAWMMIGSAVLACAAFGCVAIAYRSRAHKGAAAAVLALCAVAVSAPHVFVMGDIWAFRTNYAMAVSVGILAWTGISAVAPSERALRRLCAGLSALLVLCAAWAVNVGMVYGGIREYRIVGAALENLAKSGVHSAYILGTPSVPDPRQPLPMYAWSCYARFSIVMMDNFEIQAVAKDVWPDASAMPHVNYIRSDQAADIPTDASPVIDLWGMLKGRVPLPNVGREP